MAATPLVNPLDAFQSYSTHFILLAARALDDLAVFTKTDDKGNPLPGAAQESLEAINRVERLGDVVPLANKQRSTYLVLDTRRFAHFSVESLRHEVLIGGAQEGVPVASFATSLDMQVIDSAGISFFNFMQWLMDSQLQTSFDGMAFLLRVLFVGHNPDGSTETVQSVTIPMILSEMTLDLSETKGIYDLKFMPTMNFDVQKQPRWLNIGTATTFLTKKGANNLGEMVRSFQTELNRISYERYNRTSNDLITRVGKQPRPGTNRYGRLVQYAITIPKEWESFTWTGKATTEVVERNFKIEKERAEAAAKKQQETTQDQQSKTITPAESATFTAESGTLITDVLDDMFKQVNQIHEYANEEKMKKDDRLLKFYKHMVHISSDENRFIVHIDVIPFEVPDAKPPKEGETGKVSSNDRWFTEINGKRVPRNFFEMDYIFTGRNIDILNLDMKFENLQFLLASNIRISEGELYSISRQGQKPLGDAGKIDVKTPPQVVSYRAYDPMMIPIMSGAESSNFSQFVVARDPADNQKMTQDYQAYTRNLSAFYAASPINVNMTIRGNPYLMGKFNTGVVLPAVSTESNTGNGPSTISEEAVRNYRTALENTILRRNDIVRGSGNNFQVTLGTDSYMVTPVFAKINIRGPNVDFRTNSARRDDDGELIAGQDFSTELLIDNYYMVMKIVNNFQRGTFTQELELFVHSVFGHTSANAEPAKPERKPLA